VEKSKDSLAEVDTLAEIPKRLKLGTKDYDVVPLSLGKIRLIGNIAVRIFSIPKALETAKDIEAGEKLHQFLQDNWNAIMDDVLLGLKILLSPNGKVNLQELPGQFDNLEWELTIPDVLRAVKFISESVNVRDVLKNVSGLKGI
jgi:hypothetical protein